jgi:hypothetical protein
VAPQDESPCIFITNPVLPKRFRWTGQRKKGTRMYFFPFAAGFEPLTGIAEGGWIPSL